MAWNYLQLELPSDSRPAEPMIGPGGLTRQQAIAGVQQVLDQAATAAPDVFGEAARLWRDDDVTDDTVFIGPFIMCIYEHPDGEDPTFAAMAWLDDLAIRGTGKPAGWSAQRPKNSP